MRPRWPYTAIFVFSWPFFKSTAVLPRSRTFGGHLRFSVYFVTNTSIKCARDGKNFRIKFHSHADVKMNGFDARASLRDVHWDENSSQQDRFGPGYFFWQNQAAMQARNYGNFMPTAPYDVYFRFTVTILVSSCATYTRYLKDVSDIFGVKHVLKNSGHFKRLAIVRPGPKGNKVWFEISGGSRNRGFEKSGFHCITKQQE